MVKFSSSLSSEDKNVVSKNTLNILDVASKSSNNSDITITSTLRSPYRQAIAMYENMGNGKNISYRAAGQQIIDTYRCCKRDNFSRDETISKMSAKIIELSLKGQRVSKHCVSSEQYAEMNIIDISTHIPNPRDFVRELIKNKNVIKIITPIYSAYESNKVSIDRQEPAIHCEIKTV